jgi:hypothetical protein
VYQALRVYEGSSKARVKLAAVEVSQIRLEAYLAVEIYLAVEQ